MSFLIIVFAIVLTSCFVSPKVIVSMARHPDKDIRSIALLPGGGVLADAVGFELMAQGYNVVDAGQVKGLLARLGMTEIEIAQPENMQVIAQKGIDAILIVKSVGGYDSRPQSASIKLISVPSGQILIGATWQQGKAGAQGSPADQGARVDVGDAAKQIAEAVIDKLKESSAISGK